MAILSDPQMLQQQQQSQATQATQAAQKGFKSDVKPSVQFADVLKNTQQNGSNATVKMLANNPVGGSEVIKSAMTSGGKGKLVTSGTATSGSSTSTTSGTTASATSSTGSTATSAGTSSQSLMDQSTQLMEMNQDFNLQYLNLQENMQAESRQYTAMSNVSKTKSDTAKNSLSNVK